MGLELTTFPQQPELFNHWAAKAVREMGTIKHIKALEG